MRLIAFNERFPIHASNNSKHTSSISPRISREFCQQRPAL